MAIAVYVCLASLGIPLTTLAGCVPNAGKQDAVPIRSGHEGVYLTACIESVFAGDKEFCFARVVDARQGRLPVNSLICTVFPNPRRQSGERDECARLALICMKDDIAFELQSKYPRDELQLTEAISHRLTDEECELVRENLEKIRNGTTSKTYFLPGPVFIYSRK